MKCFCHAMLLVATAFMAIGAVLCLWNGIFNSAGCIFGINISGHPRGDRFVGFAIYAALAMVFWRIYQSSQDNPDIGLKKIHQGDKPDRAVDVVFVHGLNGHRDTTWGSFPTWLSEAMPDLGIWTMGYHASPSHWWGHSMPFVDRAKNALQHLRARGVGDRKLIFITHSLGGIIVKQMARYAFDSHDPLVSRINGVAFLATPHTGSGLANILALTKILRLTPLSRSLAASDPQLRDLDDWYRKNFRSLGIQNLVLIEKQGVPFIGTVVAEDRADPRLDGNEAIPTDEDHVSICKPKTKDGLVFTSVVQFVQKCIATASVSPPTQIAPTNIFFGSVTINQNTTVVADGAGARRVTFEGENQATLKISTVDAKVASIPAPQEQIQIQQTLMQEAFEWASKIESALDVDFPTACLAAAELEKWLSRHGASLDRSTNLKMRNILARVEIGKYNRKTVADLSRAEWFLKDPEE
jgi:hypothetical protein